MACKSGSPLFFGKKRAQWTPVIALDGKQIALIGLLDQIIQ